MRLFKKAISVLKKDGLKALIAKVFKRFVHRLYKIYAVAQDRRIGAISTEKTTPSRYKDLGCYDTQSTNYIWLKQIFSSFPLKNDDVFVDVGCGEGRILTYLYLKKFRGKIIGIEIDAEIAKIANERTKKCDNINIYQGNVLEMGDLFKDATAVYLFNPFDEKILVKFVEMIEKNVTHPLIMYYANDIYAKAIDKRENWHILRRNIINIIITPKRRYTVYRYRPNKVD